MVVNRHEARGRNIKAWKLARVLTRTCRDTGYPVAELASAHELARAKAARLAGVKMPSEQTWAQACALATVWVTEGEPDEVG